MKRRARSPVPARRAAPVRRTGPARRARNEYDFDYAGTTGELDQNEYAGDLYGGGRYGRGPFEQSQRYGSRGFESRTGSYGTLQKQFENRYTSGGYSGLKTSGRALGGPPGAASAPSASGRKRGPAKKSAPSAKAASTRAASTRAASTRATSTRAKTARAKSARASSARASSPRATPARTSSARRTSDSHIREEICERLSRPIAEMELSELTNEHLDASDVRVSVMGGRVTLEGTVSERRMKPYIEALVDACPGVQDIDNRLRVRR